MEPQMDMQQLFAAAQQMQEQLMNAQQALADAEVTGTAGGGLVTATVNGQGELLDLSISAAAVDADDAEETARTIADLVLAAVRDAYRSAEDLQQQQMGPFAAAMQGGGIPGMPGGLDQPAACRPGDLSVGERLLCVHELFLHLLRRGEQLLHVHLGFHIALLPRAYDQPAAVKPKQGRVRPRGLSPRSRRSPGRPVPAGSGPFRSVPS